MSCIWPYGLSPYTGTCCGAQALQASTPATKSAAASRARKPSTCSSLCPSTPPPAPAARTEGPGAPRPRPMADSSRRNPASHLGPGAAAGAGAGGATAGTVARGTVPNRMRVGAVVDAGAALGSGCVVSGALCGGAAVGPAVGAAGSTAAGPTAAEATGRVGRSGSLLTTMPGCFSSGIGRSGPGVFKVVLVTDSNATSSVATPASTTGARVAGVVDACVCGGTYSGWFAGSGPTGFGVVSPPAAGASAAPPAAAGGTYSGTKPRRAVVVAGVSAVLVTVVVVVVQVDFLSSLRGGRSGSSGWTLGASITGQ
mmetsp:Transcript_115495/g.313537  ORF Transcript_115495/g.313537 Transcript_115495/m.313537 type:complete len:312 (+) Transcript_115495:499-1434(+)